jgi:hypothetical protein
MRIASFFKSLFFLLRIDETFNNQLTHPLYATDKKSFYLKIKSTATHTKYFTFHGMWKTSLQTSLLQGERL